MEMVVLHSELLEFKVKNRIFLCAIPGFCILLRSHWTLTHTHTHHEARCHISRWKEANTELDLAILAPENNACLSLKSKRYKDVLAPYKKDRKLHDPWVEESFGGDRRRRNNSDGVEEKEKRTCSMFYKERRGGGREPKIIDYRVWVQNIELKLCQYLFVVNLCSQNMPNRHKILLLADRDLRPIVNFF